ncbi:MAG: lysophospholipid acyltransferase family protein [Gammaproteobacteria bacterium]
MSLKGAIQPRFEASFLLPRYWSDWVLVGVIALCLCVPRSWAMAFGEGVGKLFFRVNKKRVAIARLNLSWCFPDLDEPAREVILRTHFSRYGQAIIDMGLIWWGSRRRIERLYDFEGVEALMQRINAGEHVLLVIPHVVGVDLAGAALSGRGKGVSMMKTPSNRLLNYFLLKGRTRFDAIIVSRAQGLRPLVKAIRAGRVGYLMPDEDLADTQSVFVPFFGIPTATLPVVGRIAKLAQATVIPMYCVLNEKGRYRVTLGQPLDDFPSDDWHADAARINLEFETFIRQDPTQYLWTLKWFRSRPDDAPSPYHS